MALNVLFETHILFEPINYTHTHTLVHRKTIFDLGFQSISHSNERK